MDILNEALEDMAANVAKYSSSEEEIPLDYIIPPTIRNQTAQPRSASSVKKLTGDYFILLSGILNSAIRLQKAAGLPNAPMITTETSVDGSTTLFSRISADTRVRIEDWLRNQNIPKSDWPTFIRAQWPATKVLSPDSPFPMLGADPTMPQNRPDPAIVAAPCHPLQEEYPVWYFFYGTLADKELLTGLLRLSAEETPVLKSARVTGGCIRTWGGKYRAMVDGTDKIDGSAYLVQKKEHEDALRDYETDKYEVVRCRIEMEREAVQGCTFRFVEMADRDVCLETRQAG